MHIATGPLFTIQLKKLQAFDVAFILNYANMKSYAEPD